MKDSIDRARKKLHYRMSKDSIERSVIAYLKPLNTWEAGLTCDALLDKIEKERKCSYSKMRIYEAISLLNRFGQPWGIYIHTAYGWTFKEDKKVLEYRYFTPKESDDIVRARDKLDDKKSIIILKEKNLDSYEEITIPQEAQLKEIQAQN